MRPCASGCVPALSRVVNSPSRCAWAARVLMLTPGAGDDLRGDVRWGLQVGEGLF